MAATKRFTDIPLSINMDPDIRGLIRRVSQEDGVSENAVARWLFENPIDINQLAGVKVDERGEQTFVDRTHRVPRGV